jgi:SpoIID/LytB domain protein
VLAARTYALSKVARGVRTACSCHMDDGGGPYYDQTFTGWIKASSARGARWVSNVEATFASEAAGLAILYEGKPISAFYHSSSGGATQSSQDVWGGRLPYAQSVPDPWMTHEDNPERAWTKTVSQSAMARAFGVGSVMRVEVTERYVSGAAKTVTATAQDGSVRTLTGGRFQSALGLKSTFVTAIGGNAGAPLPTAPPTTTPAPTTPPTEAPAPTTNVTARTVSLLTPAPITTGVGATYRVVGVVRPAKKGLMTWRQKLVDGVWKTQQKTRTTAKGRYRFLVRAAKPTHAGTYRVLVVKKGTVVGVSPEFGVTLQ